MGNNIGALPYSIGNLKDLMHLDLSDYQSVQINSPICSKIYVAIVICMLYQNPLGSSES
jgi:hypothetical protein